MVAKADETIRKTAHRRGDCRISLSRRIRHILAGPTQQGTADTAALHLAHQRVQVHPVLSIAKEGGAVVAVEVENHDVSAFAIIVPL